uniref:Beta-1,4-N-acetylgalactosaminyltransferase n=1 Tax=Panagrolaimus sp. JU765 TaxID=591449 RepID=A0AC34QJW7_9BILA
MGDSQNISQKWLTNHSIMVEIPNNTDFTNKTRIGINTEEMAFDQIEKLYPDLESGGHWMPKNCQAKHRVAIIVPYRDRESQLKVFLRHLHGFLRRQNLDYAIFVVEQVANQTFNRGKLMNVGIVEALKVYDWQCFIFHDVDLLPEDDRNLYTCPEQPRHMAVAMNKYKYKLVYPNYFGGITALTKEQTEKINGFSNDFWGWGGEDDDLLMRVQLADYNISRYPMEVARYTMIKHGQETENDCRFALLNQTMDKYQEDGLSNLKYKLVKIEKKHLYTEILVDLLEDESKMELLSEDFNCTTTNSFMNSFERYLQLVY